MKLVFGFALSTMTLILVGCGTMDNRSLEYKKSHQLQPLTMPDGTTMRTPTPLYPAPNIEQRALENAPRYENQRGNRYQLPRPTWTEAELNAYQQQNSPTPSTDGQTVASQPALPNLRPHFIYDGHRNPLLQIGGENSTVWKYVTATLGSLNYKLTPLASTAVAIDKDGENYVIQLNKVGATNVLAVYGQDGQLAPQEIANEILTQIYQNWPV